MVCRLDSGGRWLAVLGELLLFLLHAMACKCCTPCLEENLIHPAVGLLGCGLMTMKEHFYNSWVVGFIALILCFCLQPVQHTSCRCFLCGQRLADANQKRERETLHCFRNCGKRCNTLSLVIMPLTSMLVSSSLSTESVPAAPIHLTVLD